ncbi:GGDEF domain-containing protein [Paucibacter sp. DJ2R-2]|uniref:GGDEF domain-containing protein n=1 Tax=Paucibacter sp. DJ2R-2 TaxID=2893558 RepID=UPI0021E469BD|nr:GGDEF domain-containing protein [Paucibacter sp. DJ2R-2]MCV2419171.1 GGDEF domain-containing protein [Paucibacter sp. DJ4R-1]MCV2437874.1 GGDEF domain-containing protein [Paucibacter sp. DJ2R-2]
MSRVRRLRSRCLWALLGWSLGLAQVQAATTSPGPAQAEALAARLDLLVRQEQGQTDQQPGSLKTLQAWRQAAAADGALDDRTRVAFDLAEARLLLAQGDSEAALRLADRLAAQPGSPALSPLLRAEQAARQGRLQAAADWAGQAWQILETGCPEGVLKADIQQGRCDYRSSWSALRLQARQRMAEGAHSLAEVQLRRSLDLAQAGADPERSALSMASLAQVNQSLSQTEQSRRWLTLALQTAQGDAQTQGQIKVIEATMAARNGDLRAQRQALDAGLQIARATGNRLLLAQMHIGLIDFYMQQKQPLRALQAAGPALDWLAHQPDARIERALRNNLAVARIQLHQFERARQELARLRELNQGHTELVDQSVELREQGEAWAAAGQTREAILAYHAERKLNAQLTARHRESSLQQLKLKYDSERKQRDLALLVSKQALVDRQLSNRQLASQVGYAVAALLGLSLLLGAVMVRRVHLTNKRLKANEVLLRAQSERDPLTDLANRRHFLAVMNQQDQPAFNGALLMVDIDHFKHVNDQHGHGIGDVVICEVARRLSHAVRQNDLVVRWGGEEFLVFAADVSAEQLCALAERILHSVAGTPVQTTDGPLRITVSLGFARFPLPPSQLLLHWEQAVNWADMALYSAKSRGRNRAMGIETVHAPNAEALAAIAADFDAACSSERVNLKQILGPGSA